MFLVAVVAPDSWLHLATMTQVKNLPVDCCSILTVTETNGLLGGKHLENVENGKLNWKTYTVWFGWLVTSYHLLRGVRASSDLRLLLLLLWSSDWSRGGAAAIPERKAPTCHTGDFYWWSWHGQSPAWASLWGTVQDNLMKKVIFYYLGF